MRDRPWVIVTERTFVTGERRRWIIHARTLAEAIETWRASRAAAGFKFLEEASLR